ACATKRFRALLRLEPLPCANRTSPRAPGGMASAPSSCATGPAGMSSVPSSPGMGRTLLFSVHRSASFGPEPFAVRLTLASSTLQDLHDFVVRELPKVLVPKADGRKVDRSQQTHDSVHLGRERRDRIGRGHGDRQDEPL